MGITGRIATAAGAKPQGRAHRTVEQATDNNQGSAGPDAAPSSPVPLAIQPKLDVGAADDSFEREADTVARSVVATLERSPEQAQALSGEDQHSCGPGCGHGTLDSGPRRQPLVKRQVAGGRPGIIGHDGGTLDAESEAELTAQTRSGGSKLPDPLRRQMEGAFGADLSGVRIHTGEKATEMNQNISAQAFTAGNHIFFRDGMPDTTTAEGKELLAHELAHTQQQGGVHRMIQRKGAPATALHPVYDWVEFSTVKGKLGNLSRSSDLKAIDNAVAAWAAGGLRTPDDTGTNTPQLNAIVTAITTWRSKKDPAKGSARDAAVDALFNFITPYIDDINDKARARALKAKNDDDVSRPLYQDFQKLDTETAKFAKKNTYDIKQDRFNPDNQSPTLMALTKKKDDGSLTDEAMDELDRLQIEEAEKLQERARSLKLNIDPTLTPEKVREIMDDKANENSLTGRTQYPELENAGSEPSAEVSEKAGSLILTYDKTDANAEERLGAVKAAVKAIQDAGVAVPALEVFLPKYGREITVKNDCTIDIAPTKIADAIFHPPNFIAVSSANTGNPKDQKNFSGELNFLSAQLGADDALTHTIIHEMGHALHYSNARSQFYNLNFASFKAQDGVNYRDVANAEVSGYAANGPREFVAEVFVAAVTGKKQFRKLVWDMYDALGGVPIAHPVKPG